MDFGLSGKSALVCASSKGLGFAIAQGLAQEGANVFMCARNAEQLNDAMNAVRATANGGVFGLACDLMNPSEIDKLLVHARETFNHIDILINNVGGPAPSQARETSTDAWQEGFERLFLSSMRLTNAVLPSMVAQRFGRIVNITSLSVLEPIENLAVSNAMRAAVSANAKTLAREVAPYGVTVNNVMPGVIHTERIDFLRQKTAERLGTSYEEEMQKTRSQIPAQRLGAPTELAALVSFLCSTHASYITGANIPVDGGLRRGWQ